MEQKKQKQEIRPTTLLGLCCFIVVVVNLLFIYFIYTSAETIKLLDKELVILEQEQRIISRSADVYEQYKDDIDIISRVFPSADTVPVFIETLENISQRIYPSATVKFNSLVPLKERDASYLLLTVSLKTDLDGMNAFLDAIESLPYITHVTSIHANTPDGFTKPADIATGLKVYVQDPFSTK